MIPEMCSQISIKSRAPDPRSELLSWERHFLLKFCSFCVLIEFSDLVLFEKVFNEVFHC